MEFITEAQVRKASKALLSSNNNNMNGKLEVNKDPKKENLLTIDDKGASLGIYLTIALKKIPETPKIKPVQIPLVHPIRNDTSQVVLLTKDPQREFKDLIAKHHITEISKVIGITKLRNKYKPFEAKRLLCASYDLVLADDRILPLLPKLLGKEFFKKKRIPIPVNLSKEKNIKNELLNAIKSTHFSLTTGPCVTIKIANLAMDELSITENVMSALPLIIANIPKKWKNVQSIHLKSSKSKALPIYSSLIIESG